MPPLLYGISAALGWGLGDYAGALSSRRIGSLWTSIAMMAIGTSALAAALYALGQWPHIVVEAVPWAIALAFLGSGSLFLLYRGLALGPIAVVSPVVASYSALTVVLVVVVLGEALSLTQAVAITTVFIGVVLATADIRQIAQSIRAPLPGIPVSLVATVGFACWATLFAAGTRAYDGMSLVLLGRIFGIALLIAAAIAVRARRPTYVDRATGGLLVTVGIFDTLAIVAFMLGIQSGQAAIAVTGSGLYPLIPAVLGIARHGERLAPNQYAGIAVVIGGLVALGLRG